MCSVVGHPLLLCWNVTTTSPSTTATFTSEIVTMPEQVADGLEVADEVLAVLDAAVLGAADEVLAVLDGDVDVWPPLPAQATATPRVEDAAAIAPTVIVVATLRLRNMWTPPGADIRQVRSVLRDR